MKAILVLLLLGSWTVHANNSLTAERMERIADAIYIVEGGSKARVPYGILSMKVRNESHARNICINTIRNSYARWQKAGAKGDFLDHLADRYCPPIDSAGNLNWKKNIRRLLKKDERRSR